MNLIAGDIQDGTFRAEGIAVRRATGVPPTLDDVEADPGTGLVPLGDMVLSLERAEAQGADEAFSTAASIFVMPVVEVDGKPVGTGKPGPVATRLREIYIDEMRKAAI